MTSLDTAQPTGRLPLRPELIGARPYGAPQVDVPVLLNVNENPHPLPPAVVEAIADAARGAAAGLNRYPDRDALHLRADLGRYLASDFGAVLPAERIWAANGSNEIMMHVLQAFGGPGRSALSFTPTYSMYPEYARDTHTRWVVGKREDDFGLSVAHAIDAIERERPSVVLLASPNNPTGVTMPVADVGRICAAARQVQPAGAAKGTACLVVLDEAYGEFRRAGTPSALSILDEHPNLAVSRTMSKAFAFAGGRLGYLAASAELVDALRVVRLPYHLSTVTQAVARAALAHSGELLAQVDTLRAERDRTAQWLAGMRHPDGRPVAVADSDANFILFGTFADRHAVWQGLLDRGVLIRETGPNGWLRVSIGTGEEMGAFRRALVEVAELVEVSQ